MVWRQHLHLNPRISQLLRTFARNERIGIQNRNDDLAHASRNQSLRARRRAAMVRAGLQANVNRCAAHIHALSGRSAQSHDFSVRATSRLGVADATGVT